MAQNSLRRCPSDPDAYMRHTVDARPLVAHITQIFSARAAAFA